MKNILLLIVGLAIGAGIAFPLVSQKSQARIQQLQTQVEELNVALTNVPPSVAGAPETVQQILARLNRLDPVPPATRAKVTRQIVHDLQSLVSLGQKGIPEIRKFLAEGKDVEYVFRDERAQAENFWAWHPGQPFKTGEYILPPSLRLGLIDVCYYVGGEESEITLAFVLNSTKRGVELACAAQILETVTKTANYNQLADGSAKRIMANLPQSHSPLDGLTMSMLTAMLVKHGDTSLVPAAKATLVKPDNTLDVNAAQYLIGVNREKSMADLYEVYQKPGTSADVRNKLASLSLPYVGSSPDAEHMVADMLNNEAIDSNTRSVNILMLGNAVPGMTSAAPITPEVAAKRIAFLQGLTAATKNEQIGKAVAQAVAALQHPAK